MACHSAALQLWGPPAERLRLPSPLCVNWLGLSAVDPVTLQSKTHPRLFFAGEVLDVDGVTGGFNFQAAWTTAYVVARAVADAVADS